MRDRASKRDFAPACLVKGRVSLSKRNFTYGGHIASSKFGKQFLLHAHGIKDKSSQIEILDTFEADNKM